jgi:hypothetical protein
VSLAAAAVFATATPASAALVNWIVDPTQSYVRLNIPDQNLTVDGLGSVSIRVRDAGSSTSWTDNGGRRAALGGMVATNYNPGTSIDFIGGAHQLYALNSGNFRPNPNAFDSSATNSSNPDGQYIATSSAQAAFAMRFRSSLAFLPDLGYGALRDVLFDLESGSLPLLGGTNFSGGTFGLESAEFDLDAIGAAGFGQPFPDIRAQDVGPWTDTNSGSGLITTADPWSLLPEMRLQINVPIQIDLGDDVVLSASFTGQLVAHLIPEPSSIFMAGLAVLGLCWAGRRRLRRG